MRFRVASVLFGVALAAASCAVHPYYPHVRLWISNQSSTNALVMVSPLSGSDNFMAFEVPPTRSGSPGVFFNIPLDTTEPGTNPGLTADVLILELSCVMVYGDRFGDGLFALELRADRTVSLAVLKEPGPEPDEGTKPLATERWCVVEPLASGAPTSSP